MDHFLLYDLLDIAEIDLPEFPALERFLDAAWDGYDRIDSIWDSVIYLLHVKKQVKALCVLSAKLVVLCPYWKIGYVVAVGFLNLIGLRDIVTKACWSIGYAARRPVAPLRTQPEIANLLGT